MKQARCRRRRVLVVGRRRRRRRRHAIDIEQEVQLATK